MPLAMVVNLGLDAASTIFGITGRIMTRFSPSLQPIRVLDGPSGDVLMRTITASGLMLVGLGMVGCFGIGSFFLAGAASKGEMGWSEVWVFRGLAVFGVALFLLGLKRTDGKEPARGPNSED